MIWTRKLAVAISILAGIATATFVLLYDGPRRPDSDPDGRPVTPIQAVASIPRDSGSESTVSARRDRRDGDLIERREEIVFPNGETVRVHLRAFRPPDPPIVPKERFVPGYYELVESALSGNAASARILYKGLTYCKNAFTDDDSLEEALRLLREEGVYTLPNGEEPQPVPAGLDNSPMARAMVRRYEFCKGISDDQKADSLRWARMAADGGDFLGMRGLVRELGKTPETFRRWKAAWDEGHASAALALSFYYRQGVSDSADGTIDYRRAYAYRLIAFKLEEAAYAHRDPGMLLAMERAVRAYAAYLSPSEQAEAEALAADILRANRNCCLVQNIVPRR